MTHNMTFWGESQMNITTIVSRLQRAAKRSALIALAALVLTSAALPTSAFAASPPVYLFGPSDGSGDNPIMP